MKKQLIKKSEIKLLGLSVRTNNQNEMNPKTAKIGELMGQYWSQNIAGKILHRKNEGVTLSVYTEYDSDEHGDYTYYLGEEVSSFEGQLEELQSCIIPAATYQKFTTPVGKMPEVVIQAWQEIWKMSSQNLEGKRAYIADFEWYDERASDPNHAALDIYIGIQSE